MPRKRREQLEAVEERVGRRLCAATEAGEASAGRRRETRCASDAASAGRRRETRCASEAATGAEEAATWAGEASAGRRRKTRCASEAATGAAHPPAGRRTQMATMARLLVQQQLGVDGGNEHRHRYHVRRGPARSRSLAGAR